MSAVVPFSEVVIEANPSRKGRTFRTTYLASVNANTLWLAGMSNKDVDRPVYATFLGSEDELRPFVANLMLGRRVLVPDQQRRGRAVGMEFLKSVGYKFIWQREAEGSIVSVFLPELFALDPGMVDPKEAKFVLLPSSTWADKQNIPTADIVAYAKRLPLLKRLNAPPDKGDWRYREPGFKHEPVFSDEALAAWVPTAYLFAAYLDRRTRAPLIADGRFYLQLLFACLDAKLASWSCSDLYSHTETFGCNTRFGFVEHGMDAAGFLPGVAFHAKHEEIEALLATEIATFFFGTKR